MHEHVCNAGVALLDCRLHPMRDFVPFMHGNIAVHSDVKIDIEIQTHFSGAAFFNVYDTRD